MQSLAQAWTSSCCGARLNPAYSRVVTPRPAKYSVVRCRRSVACNYKVTLKMPDGVKEIEVDEDTFLVDAAEENGFDLPYSCRSGSCATCTGKVESGTINQDDQTMLDPDQVAAGFALLCVTAPTSDCVILTHQEEALF